MSSSKSRITLPRIILAAIWIIVISFNGIAWSSRRFADFLRDKVMRVTGGVLGRLSSLLSFSLGEVLLLTAVLMVVAFLADVALLCVLRAKKKTPSRASGVGQIYLRVVAWTFSMVALLMTFHCFPLYHARSFRELYLVENHRAENVAKIGKDGSAKEKTYSPEDLIRLREHIIRRANYLAERMERQDDGLLAVRDTGQDAIKAMQRLGESYPALAGYYPVPKKLFWSGFFSQQYIMGYYFPFSMEANYNGVMYASNVPFTQCHELSHTKGFMYEDDANFIGYLACVSSGDEFLEYCGYIGILDYLNNDLYDYLGQSKELYKTYMQPSALVKRDNVFLTKEAWAKVEDSSPFDTETVHQASDAFLEANLQANGVEEGTFSYRLVVQYLLEYYENHELP